MDSQRIDPHKVTKPIQLLAAWLVGLVLVDGIFLGAAVALPDESQERFWLVIASIGNVVLFVFTSFFLQTKFRAQLQEDAFYAEFLRDERRAAASLPKISSKVDEEAVIPEYVGGEDEKSVVAISSAVADVNTIQGLFARRDLKSKVLKLPRDWEDDACEISVLISREIDFETKKRVLILCKSLNLKWYSYFDSSSDGLDESVIIGRFPSGDRRVYEISSDLVSLLRDEAIEAIELRVYESNSIRRDDLSQDN